MPLINSARAMLGKRHRLSNNACNAFMSASDCRQMEREVKDVNRILDASAPGKYCPAMLKRKFLAALLLLGGTIFSYGQGMAQSPSSSVNALMIRLFGDQPFTATAYVHVTNKASGA